MVQRLRVVPEAGIDDDDEGLLSTNRPIDGRSVSTPPGPTRGPTLGPSRDMPSRNSSNPSKKTRSTSLVSRTESKRVSPAEPRNQRTLPGADRDILWRIVSSKYFSIAILIGMTLIAYNRYFMWLFVYGPGNRLHDVPARRLFYLTIAFQNAGVFIYHQKARQYLKSPVQQVFLRRLFWSEIFTIFLGVPLGIVIFIQEFGNGLLPPTIGPNKTEIMPTHFSLRLMPIAGVTALPGMLHAVLAVRRDWLVPRMGDDILSPVFFQRSLIISYLAGVAGMSLVFVVISSIAMRYMEYDMGGGFSPRIPSVIEARLYISELMHLSPRTAADVEAAAALLDQSGTPLRLVMADFVVEGESVTWMEHDFARGLVAKVIEITSDNPPGKFLFNFDHIFGAILVWEPISATIFLLISFFFFVFSSRSIRDIVIAPLQKLLHALTSTASIISRDGRIVSDRPQDASPLDIGEASRRFLKLASRAVKYRNVLNGSSEGSGSGPSSRRHDSSKGNRPSGTSRALSFTAPMEPTSSREGSVAGEKADVRMKFSTAVLNGVGVRDWSACVLIGDELVQAVHLMWMKMRVPDRLCSRKTFVAWAHEVLNKHPSLEYHCAWRAVSGMHAAFLVLRERDLSHLSSLQRMGVLVAALSLHAGNVGADDDDLCDSNHELAVLYGHSSPQRQASVAVCFGTAAGKTETDIFSELSAHDARKLRGYIRDCVMAVSPGSIQQLTNQLKVLGGQLQADEAQAMVDGLQGKDTGLERACISTELAMQCVAVLSSIAHYTEAPDKWARSEHFYVKEQMAFLEKNGQNDPGQQVGRQGLLEKRVNLWRDTLLPFLTALGAVFPVLTEDVARITTAIETLSPSTSSKQTVGEGDRELQGDTQTGK